MADPRAAAAPLADPLQAILLAFPVALFPSGLLADIAYLNTEVIQWTNFAQWLIAGAVFFTGILLAWALVSLFLARRSPRRGRRTLYLVVLAVLFVLGLLNNLHHARDAWASVGTLGLVLSIACTILALVAAVLAHGRPGAGRAIA